MMYIRWFRDLDSWAVAGEDDPAHHVPLGAVLSRRVVQVAAPGADLSGLNVIAKIAFSGRLHLRTEDEKRGYKGPLFEARPGDLLVSKIRLAQGSYCVLPGDSAPVAVSPEYPVYAPDPARCHGPYLALVLRSGPMRARLTRLLGGNTTKQRVSPADFEALAVPLPPLDEQRRLAGAHETALARAAAMEAEAEAGEADAWAAFEAALAGDAAPVGPLPDAPLASSRPSASWTAGGRRRCSAAARGRARAAAATRSCGSARWSPTSPTGGARNASTAQRARTNGAC